MTNEVVEFVYTGGPPKKESAQGKAWKAMTHLRVPSSITAIDTGAFWSCRLKEVELCDGLKCIAPKAFTCCSSLERITIPSTVKEIGREAFSHCFQLVEVELRKGLQQIQKLAFHACDSLERISPPVYKR